MVSELVRDHQQQAHQYSKKKNTNCQKLTMRSALPLLQSVATKRISQKLFMNNLWVIHDNSCF